VLTYLKTQAADVYWMG